MAEGLIVWSSHGAIGRDLDVHRLEIAMDDVLLVDGFERFGNLFSPTCQV